MTTKRVEQAKREMARFMKAAQEVADKAGIPLHEVLDCPAAVNIIFNAIREH